MSPVTTQAAQIYVSVELTEIDERTPYPSNGVIEITGDYLVEGESYRVRVEEGKNNFYVYLTSGQPTAYVRSSGSSPTVQGDYEIPYEVTFKTGDVPAGTEVYLNTSTPSDPEDVLRTVLLIRDTDGSGDPVVTPPSSGGDDTPAPSPVNFTGSEGRDITNGGDLNDELRGFGGDDQLNGGGGDDFINGNVGNDYIIGAQGNDYLMGGSENDEVRGGSGNDFTNGNRGNDFVFGGNGNDTVRGGSEDDVIFGGAGDDQLYGDKGNDQLNGGLGADIFHLSTGIDVIQDFEVGVDGLNGLSVSGITFSDTENGALISYDGGSTLLVGVESSALA